MPRTAAALLTLTLVPVAGWTAGVWHATSSASDRFTPSPTTFTQPTTPTHDSGWSSLPVPLIEEPDPSENQDLYGNEVFDAVAQYKSDRSGSLYEEHSPQTEVARLKPPTT